MNGSQYSNSYGDFICSAIELVRFPPTKMAVVYVAANLMGKSVSEVGLQLLRTIDKGIDLGILVMDEQYLHINRESTAQFPYEFWTEEEHGDGEENNDDQPEKSEKKN